MSTPTIKVGQGNWGIKANNLLGYANTEKKFTPVEFTSTRSLNTATRVNASGNIEIVNANIPRIDYFGGQAALLVEPSAQNFLVRSEEFDNASWGKNATGINTSIGTSGIQANVAISPDGTQNADRVNFNLQTDLDLGLNQNYSAATTGQVYNTSIWFRGEGTNIGKQIKVRIKRALGGSYVGSDATITLTSGWVRFASAAITLGASNSGVHIIVSSNDATDALIWGAQLEQGSVATSYIPTTTGSVTRNADVVSVSGAVSGSIGQTEGTVYAEFQSDVASDEVFFVSRQSGAGSNRIAFTKDSANILKVTLVANNVMALNFSGSVSGMLKMAFAYKTGSSALYVNGNFIASSTTTFTFSATGLTDVTINKSSILIGGSVLRPSMIRAIALYTTRLTNAQLASLTT